MLETFFTFSFTYIFISVIFLSQLHTKCDFLLDNEAFGGGSFQPDVSDPEHSNADSSCLWELNLARLHYHPDIRAIANHIINGAPSQGAWSLPNKILQRYKKCFCLKNVVCPAQK